MILSITDVTELKKEITDKLSVKIHFHDGCGGQYFTLDHSTEELQAAITAFLAAKHLKAVFSENGEYFTVESETV